MKAIKLTLACLMFASAVLIVSCKKSDSPVDNDTTGASDNALAENSSNDIVTIGAQASDKGSLSSYRLSNPENILAACATITWDTTGVNRTITVTFDGAVCMDGRTRSGSITYDFSGSTLGARHYRDPGFSFTVTTNNYIVDGNQVNIVNKIVTNTTPAGFNPSNTNETWHITANINIVKASGGSISWICDRVKTLLNTSTTYNGAAIPIDWPNARVGITGNASGSRSNGETFTVNITNQLIRDFGSCHPLGKVPFIQGTFIYTPIGKAARTFDYGNGTCDFAATVTINGKTYNIYLP